MSICRRSCSRSRRVQISPSRLRTSANARRGSRILRNSSDAAHRALAAQVLGYAADKPAVVEDLVYGMSDPSDEVRNNVMRTLMAFAEMRPGTGSAIPRVPAQPFIDLLGSPVWSDRNKASLALMALSAARDPELLAALREQALAPLVEMVRWKSDGHAQPAFFILGRIARYSDEATYDSLESRRARDDHRRRAKQLPLTRDGVGGGLVAGRWAWQPVHAVHASGPSSG